MTVIGNATGDGGRGGDSGHAGNGLSQGGASSTGGNGGNAGSGGGIAANGGSLTVIDSTISNNSSGHVFYARTHNHSSMGVATGPKIVSTTFDVPLTAETGTSSLVVVANGIASTPVSVTVQ